MPCPCCNTCGFCAFSSTISLTITDDYSGLANQYPIAPQSLGTFVLSQNTSEGSCPPYWEYSDWFSENRLALLNGNYVSLPFWFGIYARFDVAENLITAQVNYQIEPVWLNDRTFLNDAAPIGGTEFGSLLYGVQSVYASSLNGLFALYYNECDPGDIVGTGPEQRIACAGCVSSMEHSATLSYTGGGAAYNGFSSATILWEFS